MNPQLIIALDFERQEEAFALLDQVDPALCAVKVGHEMFTLFGASFVRALIQRQFKIFLDLKFHDIPNTVARACAAAAELGVWMMNVHATGGLKMMQAAKHALKDYGLTRPKLIAVTVLTSMHEAELATLGVSGSLMDQVIRLALMSLEAGLDGVVCSAFEVPMIKAACGAAFLTVTPGIRLPGAIKDDQTRIVTPTLARQAGSDYLVVGRPITRAIKPQDVIDEILRDDA